MRPEALGSGRSFAQFLTVPSASSRVDSIGMMLSNPLMEKISRMGSDNEQTANLPPCRLIDFDNQQNGA